jgi:type 1 glutamine amidotransferase
MTTELQAIRRNRVSRSLTVLLLIAVLGLTFCTSTGPSEGTPRVLLFTRTEAFVHSSIPLAVEAIREVAADAGAEVDATDDSDIFDATDLAEYDVVVFLMTTGDVLDAEQQSAFTEFIRRGGGYAGVHSAADTEYDWAWYGQLVGAYFASHPPGIREGTIFVRDADHAATSHLPATWVRADEWYDFRDVQPGSATLLDVDETTYKTSSENPQPSPRPIAWFREFDGGRSFYTGLGHTDESWSDPLFVDHVWGGILAAAGLAP